MDVHHATALVACGVGVVGTLGVYGVLQERILALPYDGVFFTSSAFLVLSNRLFGALFASLMTVLVNTEHAVSGEKRPLAGGTATWVDYLLVSMSNVLATGAQYEAVKYLAYSVQMVGKSTKMLPVMYWGTVMARKTYSRSDWALAAAVSAGCALFLMGGSLSQGKVGGPHTEAVGLSFLVVSILSDGFTSMYQEQLFARRVPLSTQMLRTNLCSAAIAVVVLVAQGELHSSLSFARQHPAFCHDVITLSLAAAAAQVVIYLTIARFGAVALAALINVRQCVSILLSNTLYHHALSALQVVGVTVMFTALGTGHCQRFVTRSPGILQLGPKDKEHGTP